MRFFDCNDQRLLMDIEHLRTLLALNRTRHFRLTGEELFITQSAVSARLKKLEEEFNVALFERSSRDIQPTPEGYRLLRHAETIIAIYRRALHDVALAEDARVQLAIGGVSSLWDILLQDWTHDLYRSVPRLALLTESHGHDLLLRRLLDGALDLIFLYEPPQLEEIVPVEVAAIPLIMVSSEPGRSAEQALADDAYVMVDWGHSFALQHARAFPDATPAYLRMNQPRSALAFLLACGGSAYLAEQTVLEAIDDGQLHRVDDAPVITRHAHAVYGRRSTRAELIGQVLGYF